MTIFSLGALAGSGTWRDLLRNLVWTVPGNLVGGGVLVGVAYAWLGTSTPQVATPAEHPPLVSVSDR